MACASRRLKAVAPAVGVAMEAAAPAAVAGGRREVVNTSAGPQGLSEGRNVSPGSASAAASAAAATQRSRQSHRTRLMAERRVARDPAINRLGLSYVAPTSNAGNCSHEQLLHRLEQCAFCRAMAQELDRDDCAAVRAGCGMKYPTFIASGCGSYPLLAGWRGQLAPLHALLTAARAAHASQGSASVPALCSWAAELGARGHPRVRPGRVRVA